MSQRTTTQAKTTTNIALQVSREIFDEERREGAPTAYAIITALALSVNLNAELILGLRQKRRSHEPLTGAEIQELVALGRIYGLIDRENCKQSCNLH